MKTLTFCNYEIQFCSDYVLKAVSTCLTGKCEENLLQLFLSRSNVPREKVKFDGLTFFVDKAYKLKIENSWDEIYRKKPPGYYEQMVEDKKREWAMGREKNPSLLTRFKRWLLVE